jgi:hypothetical protein
MREKRRRRYAIIMADPTAPPCLADTYACRELSSESIHE